MYIPLNPTPKVHTFSSTQTQGFAREPNCLLDFLCEAGVFVLCHDYMNLVFDPFGFHQTNIRKNAIKPKKEARSFDELRACAQNRGRTGTSLRDTGF